MRCYSGRLQHYFRTAFGVESQHWLKLRISGHWKHLLCGSVFLNNYNYHTDALEDTCAVVEAKFVMSDVDFKSWDTVLDAGCTNLWLGSDYCVGI